MRHTDARGNFVFVDTKRPQADIRAALLTHDIDIGRGFPPYNTWSRISIGLSAENARAQEAFRTVVSGR